MPERRCAAWLNTKRRCQRLGLTCDPDGCWWCWEHVLLTRKPQDAIACEPYHGRPRA